MFKYPFTVQLERGHQIDHERLKVLRVYESYEFELRSLTRREFEFLRDKHPDMIDFRSAVLDLAVLRTPELFHGQPFAWDAFYAGLAEQVYQKILTLSGFIVAGGSMDPDLIEPARRYLGSEEAKYDLLIMTAFKRYGLEDLLDIDPQLWHRLIGLAEAECRVMGLDPDTITNPGNIEKKRALAQAEAEAQRQLQMMMTRKDGSMVESTTQQMSFTGG